MRTAAYPWTLAAAAVAAALALAGCGSASGAGTAAGSSPAPASSAAQSGAATGSATAHRKLAAIGLQATDLPPGYAASPHSAAPSPSTSEQSLPACAGAKDTDPDRTGEADSPDYTSGAVTASSTVESYASQDDVDADSALFSNPKAQDCFNQIAGTALAAQLPAGATVNSAQYTVTPGTGGGPSNVAGIVTGVISITVGGRTAQIYQTVVAITGPKTEVGLDFISAGAPVPAALQSALTTAIATRAAAA
jgi:hypothetical protein